jgi:hypothetical protein
VDVNKTNVVESLRGRVGSQKFAGEFVLLLAIIPKAGDTSVFLASILGYLQLFKY